MEDLERVRITVLPGGRVDRRNAAAFLGRKPQTLARCAMEKSGPPYNVVKGRTYYALHDLEQFAGAGSMAA